MNQPLVLPQTPASSPIYAWYVVLVLMLAMMVAYIDRQVLSLLIEPIKHDLQVSDTQVGLLAGFAFALFYTVLGLPIARLADSHNRQRIITVGILIWTGMTALCGLARTYSTLLLARVGVGVGEACLSPSAYSILADYFPPQKLARAVGVYVAGLYLGTGFAMLGGAAIVQMTLQLDTVTLPLFGEIRAWQLAFFIAAVPGVLVTLLMLTVREPVRSNFSSSGEARAVVARKSHWQDVFRYIGSQKKYFLLLCVGSSLVGTIITAYLVWTPEFLRRTYGSNIVESAYVFGVILICFGVTGTYAGGWLAGYYRKRGYQDAEMRAVRVTTLALLPFAIAAPLAPNENMALILLCPVVFLMSMPQSLGPSMIQLTCPNHLRAQVTAMFTLLAVLSGYTAGGVLVALLTDYVFHDESALNYSLAIVGGVFVPVAAICFHHAMASYTRAQGMVEQFA
jgi:MFS family permease